ncbi:MAG: aminoglycoside 6-adenylyltransferase [[Clostridium] innocuum]
MRTEDEIMKLLINTAAQDDRIRAAYLEGSRVNPDVPRDMFQDYDVVYVVKETASFQKDNSWIDRFGERLYMQYPEDSVYDPGIKKTVTGGLCS